MLSTVLTTAVTQQELVDKIDARSEEINLSYGQCRILSTTFDSVDQNVTGYHYKPEPALDYKVDVERSAKQIDARSEATNISYGQCRILSTTFTDVIDQHVAGYSYKPELALEYTVDAARTETDTCQLEVVSHEQVNRSFLLSAPRPLIIRGATDAWPARHRWDLESLRANHNETVFQAGPSWVRTLGSLLDKPGKYYTGQVGLVDDCYTDGGHESSDGRPRGVLKSYDRQYSPFLADAAKEDFTLPQWALPARLLYMGLGAGAGGGVQAEEHPSAWFAAIKGRKRWLLHPPNLNSPGDPRHAGVAQFSMRPRCAVREVFTSTLTCDQEEGDILWLPGGWWHETCNLDSFSAGVGGVTFENMHWDAQRKKGRCSLSEDAELNRLLRERSGGEYAVDQVPYCAAHDCPLLPVPEAEPRAARQ